MKTSKISIHLQFFCENPDPAPPAEECTEADISDLPDGLPYGESDAEAQTDTFADAARAEMARQAEQVRREFPDFDLDREMLDPLFSQIVALGGGVEMAYHAVHHKQILEAVRREAAQKTAEKIAGAIRSGSRRPIESGGSSQAPSVSTFDYSKATKQQREAFKKDLRARMARGEKVYPTR